MNSNFSKPVKRYIRAAKRLLACPHNYRSNFTTDMKKDIQQYLLENTSAGYEEITSYFGTPAELARLYLDSVPPEEINAYTARKKFFTRFGCGVLILLLTVTIFILYAKLQEPREIDTIYIEETTWEFEH